MTDTHAPFAPSGLHRVVACPGSYRLIRAARERGWTLDTDSEHSEEGTAAHWVAAECLLGRPVAVGTLTPNGVAVTDEMVEGAELYVDTVCSMRHCSNGDVEQPVQCPSIHPECYGTPDFAYGPRDGILRIIDYKFGHRYVDVFENWQLLAYAAGRMKSLLPTVEVVLQIVQPRSYHRDGPVRTWTIKGHELFNYAKRLNDACRAAESPDAACTVGAHCYQCPARHVCEVLQRAELSALDLAGSTAPLNLTVGAKALRLRMVRRAAMLLEQIDGGLTEDLSASVRSGTHVPGWSLQSSAGREQWTAEPAEVIALGTALGVDVSKPGLITPNQARKAGMPDEVVSAYSARAAGSLKLVETDEALARVFRKS